VKPAGQRTGIFGGAFDPVHLGHVQIAQSFLASNLIDRLLVLPTPVSPHKETYEQTPFLHRFKMLELAFQEIGKVDISNIETFLPTPSYTLRTIRYLQKENPDIKYFLCVGEDSLALFHTWWKYEEILDRVPVIAAGRPGIESSKQSQSILNRVIFADHLELDISSSDIRKRVNKGDNRLSDALPDAVVDYIHANNLYSH
jgi:nicotinate-nucleotide adenylyltransferase